MKNGRFKFVFWIIRLCLITSFKSADAQQHIQKIFDYNTNDEIGYSILKLKDNSFLLSGTTNSWFANVGALVCKTDSLFNIQWSKFYTGPQQNWGFETIKITDSTFLINRYALNSARLIYIDWNGDTIWSKDYNFSNHRIEFKFLDQIGDTLILCGADQYNNGFSSNGIISGIDIKTGNVFWAKSYLFNSHVSTGFRDVKKSVDNNKVSYYVYGNARIDTSSFQEDNFILKFDPRFSLINMKILTNSSYNYYTSGIELSDDNNHLVISFTNGNTNDIMELDSNLNFLWWKQFLQITRINKVKFVPNSNNLIFTLEDNSRVVFLDRIGNIIKEKYALFNPFISNEQASFNDFLFDGSKIIWFGQSRYYGQFPASFFDFALMTTDINGEGCNSIDTVSLSYTNGIFATRTDTTLQVSNILLNIYDSLVYFNVIVTDTMRCVSVGLSEGLGNLKNLSIYPNPFRETFTISGLLLNEKYYFKVYNLFGILEYKTELYGLDFIDLKIPDITDGIYLIDIGNNENEIFKSKIIKM